MLKEWMGTSRYIYNRALDESRINGVISSGELTKKLVTQKSREGIINIQVPDWTFNTPKDIRKGSVRDLEKAFKTAVANLKRGNITHFKLGYRSKKTWASIELPKTCLNFDGKLFIYPTYMEQGIKVSKRQVKRDDIKFNHDCRLQYLRGQWFLLVPCTKVSKPRPAPTKECCALDPGVRTFQTIYSPDELCKVQQNRVLISKLHKRLDNLQSLRSKGSITSSSYKRGAKRTWIKLINLVTEMHYKTIQYLKEFKTILLPSFDSQEMMSKRGLHSKTKRNMGYLSHYLFKTRLKNSPDIDPYSKVYIVCEAYTSKTCGQCGSLNISGVDTYNCRQCGLVTDRDINGARNILLKHLKGI